ncbi:unnamed protein product [Rotaria magnacalcarata]|uniref:Uncharacterized protein n=2 Tax=Rotaria magnacalcarata TaxID=392030 RepID=A0A819C842_9BILA|nr:unnamed protein product [Rotaria magnacalcarata]
MMLAVHHDLRPIVDLLFQMLPIDRAVDDLLRLTCRCTINLCIANREKALDLRDLDRFPVPGLGVCCPDESNPFLLHCNLFDIFPSEDYPLTGPAGNIAPGLEFDSTYHSHIHFDGRNGHALCTDLLTNYASHFRSIDDGNAKQASGWSPGYTLSTALLQIVTFFAEPDLRHDPLPESIIRLRNMVTTFQCHTCGHSYEKPNPQIINYSTNVSVQEEAKSTEIDDEKLKAERKHAQRQRELLEKLTCGVTKQNVIEDNICLGYPLLVKRNNYGKLQSETVLELISYDAYVAEIQKSGEDKLDYYEHLKFRSVTGKDYNHWLPIFINEAHFQKGQTIIQNSISVIYNGSALGSARYDFQPFVALKVLTALMNQSGVQLFNGEMFESKHAIEAYCHFLRLLMHFIDIYPELERNINKMVDNFMRHSQNRNKKVVPDIGEFLIQIALSNKYQFDEIRKYIYEEYFARQILWIERKGVVENLFDIKPRDLPNIFEAAKVSNHLLVSNLEMAETFIFSGVKEYLDRSYGYPPDNIVEKFQQRLKAIKAIDRYSEFVRAVKMNDTIKTPDAMIDFIISSVEISNQQGYTRIQPAFRGQSRRSYQSIQDDQHLKYQDKRQKR